MFEPVEDKQEPSVAEAAATVSNVKFAFGLKKANDKKIVTGANLLAERDKKGRVQQEDDEDDVTPETITHVEDRKVKGTKPEPKEGPLVIPMIIKNDWRTERLKEQTIKNGENVPNGEGIANGASEEAIPNGEDDLAARAKAALLNEAKGGEAESGEGNSRAVPLLLANRIPAGFETDDKLDVSLRPDEEDADYDSVPIEEFGLAVLRGMGWKEGDPIGNSNKQLIKAKIPELRPKGLGLGADRSKANKLSKQPGGQASSSKTEDAKEESNLLLKIGSYVKIVTGPHRESYGKVESFDEDNARAVIRLAIGNTAITVSQYGVEVVSLKDYERDSKCINKSKYDRYKKQQESQFVNHVVEEDPLAVTDDL
uniref:G-patch domain-containing protein n=1 Tax=Plectus sambesii TaxID=2011161 RepID=A0A914URX7_9BILA